MLFSLSPFSFSMMGRRWWFLYDANDAFRCLIMPFQRRHYFIFLSFFFSCISLPWWLFSRPALILMIIFFDYRLHFHWYHFHIKILPLLHKRFIWHIFMQRAPATCRFIYAMLSLFICRCHIAIIFISCLSLRFIAPIFCRHYYLPHYAAFLFIFPSDDESTPLCFSDAMPPHMFLLMWCYRSWCFPPSPRPSFSFFFLLSSFFFLLLSSSFFLHFATLIRYSIKIGMISDFSSSFIMLMMKIGGSSFLLSDLAIFFPILLAIIFYIDADIICRQCYFLFIITLRHFISLLFSRGSSLLSFLIIAVDSWWCYTRHDEIVRR